MTANFWNKGEIIDYKNTGNTMIDAGEIVKLNNARIGIAGCPINPDEIGSVHVTGVWEIKKVESEAIGLGANVYYTDTGITATAGSNIPAGWCIRQAKAEDKTILVKVG